MRNFLTVFIPLTVVAVLFLLVYAPYRWGEGLVQEEIALQELVPKNYSDSASQRRASQERTAREERIRLLGQYFPVNARAFLWQPSQQRVAVVRATDAPQVFLGNAAIEAAIARYRAVHPMPPPMPEPSPAPPPVSPEPPRWKISPEEFMARKAERERRQQEYLASLPPDPVVLDVGAARTLSVYSLVVEICLVVVSAGLVGVVARWAGKKKVR